MDRVDGSGGEIGDVLTTSGAATLLGVAVSTVQKWVESGLLVSWKTPGGHRRIPASAVRELLHGHVTSAAAIARTESPTTEFSAVYDEVARVRAVIASGLLDTPPSARFDRLVRLASQVTGAPIAVISLLEKERQWFKARVGIECSETPRSWAFCNYTVLSDAVLSVDDATADGRFSSNPLVTGDDAIRFYAGCALHDRGGYRLGTLCVLDRKPRSLSADQTWALQELAALASDEIQRSIIHS
jgi:excisionase family DNA binding protein